MQVVTNTMFATLRLVQPDVPAAPRTAQEVPSAGALDAHFRAANAAEGWLIPARNRPTGCLWRLHRAPSITGPRVAPSTHLHLEGATA
ncbi:MAG: hypothetical protein RLZZ238_1625 [Planctomycetota bacterium]